MPRYGPISRRDLIAALRRYGFQGPIASGKHPYMIRGDHSLSIPNPHGGDIGIELLKRVLRQAGIDRATWEKL